MTDKEKVAALSLYLGICLGFMCKCDILDMFKASHPEVVEEIYKCIYSKEI